MTEENWNAIDEKTRAKLEEAAKLTTLQSYFHFLDRDMKAMDTYRKAGIDIIQLDKSITHDLAQRGNKMIDDKLEARQADEIDAKHISKDYSDYRKPCNRTDVENGKKRT